MQVLQDRPRSIGNISVASKERNFGPSSGWEEDVDNNDHQNLSQKLIEVANVKVSLDTVFRKYGIAFRPSYSATGWAFKCICPFPDHKDSAPSFGYNPDAGIFNCFGCHRGGKAVEFVASMESRSRADVAREIIGNYSNDEILLHNSKFDFEKLRDLLFSFADTIRAFKARHSDSEANKYAKAVSWNLDVYLRKNAPFSTIVLDDLEVRILKLKSQLGVYGESD